MLISPSYLRIIWNIRPSGILHVGGHLAEESKFYSKVWPDIFTIWVEAQENKCDEMRKNLDPRLNLVLNGAAWGEAGIRKIMKITNNSQSSSLLDLKLHSDIYPDIKVVSEFAVTTFCIDKILDEFPNIDFINLDVQGAELEALKGGGEALRRIKWIYTEINKKELYKNCCLVSDIDTFLGSFGFKRVETRWIPRVFWGDAIYVNIEIVKNHKFRFLISGTFQFAWKSNKNLRYFFRKISISKLAKMLRP